MRQPGGPIGKDRFRLFGQPGDQRGGQGAAAHVIERRGVGTKSVWPARSRSRKFSRLFDGRVPNQVNRSLPIWVRSHSPLCAVRQYHQPISKAMLQSGTQHIASLAKEVIMLLDQQALDLALGDRQAERLQQRGKPR